MARGGAERRGGNPLKYQRHGGHHDCLVCLEPRALQGTHRPETLRQSNTNAADKDSQRAVALCAAQFGGA